MDLNKPRRRTGLLQGLSKGFPREPTLVYLLTFVMGACGIAYEYTLSKISSDLLGNSVQQWAVIIGLMMFFMGIGSDVQKHIPDRLILDRFVLLELVQGLIGGFGPIVLFVVFGAYRDYFKVLQYLFIITIGLIIGLEIPLLTRVNERYTSELRINIGGVLRADYIGAFAGAVVWIFVLLEHFSLVQIGFLLGALNILVSGLIFWHFQRQAARRMLWAPLLVLALAALAFGFAMAPEWSYHAEQRLYVDRIIFSRTTRYQHIVITRARSGDIYCYINGNLQFSSFDEHIYHEMLVHPAMQAAPRRNRVLVLGGGDGLAVREVLKYPDVESVTLVDIDPEMTRLARENPILSELNGDSLASERVGVVRSGAVVEGGTHPVYVRDRTRFKPEKQEPVATVYRVNIDAARFVEQVSGLYDVIILDFPDPNNLELAKLYSRSFYGLVASKLAPYGIFVQQSTSPIHSKEAFLCIGRTMRAGGLAAVPYHQNVPTFGEWGWWIGGLGGAYTREQIRISLRGIETVDADTRYLTPEIIASSLSFGKGMLDTGEAEVSTLLNSAVFHYYRRAVRREAY